MVTHSVEELGWVVHIGKGLAEVCNIVEVVIPIGVETAISHTERIYGYTLLTILLNLGLQTWNKGVGEGSHISQLVGKMNIGYGNNDVTVIVYLAQVKVVTLRSLRLRSKHRPKLRNNISTLGNCLVTTWDRDKYITGLLL